eukprot:CAMPEP_0185772776 /NCGR_PEP_ID=MMETSP1174-20130828/70801_1 /TAXON_ID=35687 /ORGANISM="Dictyocha speculum, Strain CCMP1381" /LENGTH=294 /DNA_ID=CAMNT_0028459203 /DNA_START=39 /DNA_END=923 /DNA_ORIENTATION=+
MEMEAVELSEKNDDADNDICTESNDDFKKETNMLYNSWLAALNPDHSGLDPRIKVECSLWFQVWEETTADQMKVPEIRRSHQNGGKPMYLSTFGSMACYLFESTLVVVVFVLTLLFEFVISYLHWLAWGCRNLNDKLRVDGHHASSMYTNCVRNVCRGFLVVLDAVFRGVSLAPIFGEAVGTEMMAVIGFVVVLLVSCSGPGALHLHKQICEVNTRCRASIARNFVSLPQNRHNLVAQGEGASHDYNQVPIPETEAAAPTDGSDKEEGDMVIIFADGDTGLAGESMGTFHNNCE